MGDTCEVVRVACKETDGNTDGFFDCDVDKVPAGAVLWGSTKDEVRADAVEVPKVKTKKPWYKRLGNG